MNINTTQLKSFKTAAHEKGLAYHTFKAVAMENFNTIEIDGVTFIVADERYNSFAGYADVQGPKENVACNINVTTMDRIREHAKRHNASTARVIRRVLSEYDYSA